MLQVKAITPGSRIIFSVSNDVCSPYLEKKTYTFELPSNMHSPEYASTLSAKKNSVVVSYTNCREFLVYYVENAIGFYGLFPQYAHIYIRCKKFIPTEENLRTFKVFLSWIFGEDSLLFSTEKLGDEPYVLVEFEVTSFRSPIFMSALVILVEDYMESICNDFSSEVKELNIANSPVEGFKSYKNLLTSLLNEKIMKVDLALYLALKSKGLQADSQLKRVSGPSNSLLFVSQDNLDYIARFMIEKIKLTKEDLFSAVSTLTGFAKAVKKVNPDYVSEFLKRTL